MIRVHTAALQLLLTLFLVGGCSYIREEINKDKKNPDNVPVSKFGADLPGRKVADQRVLDCTHYAAAGYNQAQDAAVVGQRLLHKKQLEAAGQQLKLASKLASLTLDRISQEKLSGVWRNGLRYQTLRDGLLGEQDLIARLTDIRDTSLREWRDNVWPPVLEQLRKKYNATTPEQLTTLEQQGRPKDQVFRKGERCWIFESDREVLTTCWNRPGNLVRRTVRENPNPPALSSGQVAIVTCPKEEAPEPAASPAPPEPAQVAAVEKKQAQKPPPPKQAPKVKLPEKERLRLKIAAHYAAGTLGAGRCEERSCYTKGWNVETPEGVVQVRCKSGDCLKSGWTAMLPDGESVQVGCDAAGCLQEGWTATRADRSQTFYSCTFDNCWKDGWTTTHADNSQSHTSCNYRNCEKEGWTSLLSNGTSMICRCISRNCREEGALCN